ncbi:MAG: Tim44/TimA family putative adaptor protein [Amphiplicatus sp.]
MLIFAGVALFVIWRLISVLGTRTGHEQRRDVNGAPRTVRASETRAEAAAPATVPAKSKPVSPEAAPLQAADPAFDETAYLRGARAAYEMIVEAFAAGDLKSIRRFLSQSVYDAFRAAVADREARGHQTDLKFVGLDKAAIVASEASEGALTAVTDFASNQVRVTRDREGNIVDGDPSRIDLVRDRWTFSKKLGASDPNWILVATGGAS